MRVFVTGVCGQLGHDVVNELIARGHEAVAGDITEQYSGADDGSAVVSAPYKQLDITDSEAVKAVLTEVQPDAVVHCAAWTAVDAAEDEENKAKVYAVNSDGTRNIAAVCRELDCKVVILLSAQEETYGSGAMTGAFQIDADEAIVVDVSFANQPDVSGQYGNIELNKGPMLGYSPILNRQMTERLKALAESEGIPLQYEAMSGRTGTNADHISVTKSGVKTAMLSIPERYMHTQAEVMHPDDAERTAKLIAAYILSGGAFDD